MSRNTYQFKSSLTGPHDQDGVMMMKVTSEEDGAIMMKVMSEKMA
jgi:hypothetical protein